MPMYPSEGEQFPGGIKVESEDVRVKIIRDLQMTEARYQKIGECLQRVHDGRRSTRNILTMMEGILHAFQSKDTGNPEWREHAAGSLRETLHEMKHAGEISRSFNAHIKRPGQSNFPTTSSPLKVYEKMENFYKYFSSVHHHDSVGILMAQRAIKGPQVKQSDDTTDNFIEITIDFLRFMSDFFEEHYKYETD